VSGEIGRRLTVRSGETVLEVGTVAAVIAGLRVGGVELTEPIPEGEAPLMCNGIHLSPWPNRVRDGRWQLDGAAQQLDITEPERRTALHGLLQFTDFEVREEADDRVRLGAFVPPQHGWPFALEVEVEFRAVADGIRVTHTAINRSAVRVPYATGAHPYLRIGDTGVENLRVFLAADTFFEVDERLNPVGTAPVDGTPVDLRHGPAFRELDLDTAYGDVRHVDGASAWVVAPDGAKLELLQDEDWRYSQVFTTDIFPQGGGLRSAVAVEPMTAPPDALNSGEALIWLEPGERWSGSWGLRFTPAAP
jgi:aldose 1-epimerase